MKPAADTKTKTTKNENNAFLPWIPIGGFGGVGANELIKKHKELKTCPLKCPTFSEAQKVS